MRFIKPALLFVAVATAVSCAKRPIHPIALPETPAPSVDTDRRAALALLRTRLEVQTPRSRVRLPADAQIRLTAVGARTFTFSCRYFEYVPASSLPWVYEAAGRVDLRAGQVSLDSLDAEAADTPSPSPLPSTRQVTLPLEPR